MYGFEVPRNHEQAMVIDRRNGNTKFADAENTEIFMIDEFSTFKDLGFGGNPGPDYKKILSAGQLCDLQSRPLHVASRTAIYGFSTIADDATALG